MEPASFPESNVTMDTPEGMTVEQVMPIAAWKGQFADGVPACVTCWKPTKEELEQLTKTGRIWLVIIGNGMPPVTLMTQSPFEVK